MISSIPYFGGLNLVGPLPLMCLYQYFKEILWSVVWWSEGGLGICHRQNKNNNNVENKEVKNIIYRKNPTTSNDYIAGNGNF